MPSRHCHGYRADAKTALMQIKPPTAKRYLIRPARGGTHLPPAR
jgi:hypothetical protein